MNFIIYLETKLREILFHLFFAGLTLLLLAAAGFPQAYLVLFAVLSVCASLVFHGICFRQKTKRQEEIMALTDSLEEAWYASEVLPKPKDLENEAYYYALKRACKAMSERLDELDTEQKDYREYIETVIFPKGTVHEIK